MAQLAFTTEELMAEHAYAKEHVEAGYRLHGGFDSNGNYISPRTLHRWPAVHAWQQQLKSRGVEIIHADKDLLKRGNYPNVEQQAVLLKYDIGQPFWNSLTTTGIVEARGQALVHFVAPDFQNIVVENISDMALGHLNKGLLKAHGLDEGGDPEDRRIGAHDDMWFAVRDTIFGKNAYPIVEPGDVVNRPQTGRPIPHIPEAHEGVLMMFMNVLMIEIRAEAFFSFCCDVLRDERNFTHLRNEAERSAQIVERIRIDEQIHVEYLRTLISEFRSLTIVLNDGSKVKGAQLIDPVWTDLVDWHGKTIYDHSRDQTRAALEELLKNRADGNKILAELDTLETEFATST